MPRASRKKIYCAFEDDAELSKLPKARTVYTEEEKASRKFERMIKARERERKKEEKQKRLEWEEKLPVQKGSAHIPNDVEVMFISDAKKQFALSERELASLPIYKFKSSPKRLIALSDLLAHATDRLLDIDVTCPALAEHMVDHIPYVMTKTSDYVTGLIGRRRHTGRWWGRSLS